MNKPIEVIVIVEGRTEENFINKVLKDYLDKRNIIITPIQFNKSGQRGGDVRFTRAISDISDHLQQRQDTYVSLFFDYYGVSGGWPGIGDARKEESPLKIAEKINEATHAEVNKILSAYNSANRFIPYVSVHEFESLLFSDGEKLARSLHVDYSEIQSIIDEFQDPEKINNSKETAPSKRLGKLYRLYKKTIMGPRIAKIIKIDCIRSKCAVFNNWLERLENIASLG